MALTITITDPRTIDGWVEAANRSGTTAETLATDLVAQQGRSYADLFRIGIVTSAAFMARIRPAEYAAIMTAMEHSPELAGLVGELTAAPNIHLDDPRLLSGLQALAGFGLIAQSRIPELLAYPHPAPLPSSSPTH